MQLFKAVHRLTTDETFRTDFLAAPKEHLAELGVSPKAVEMMVPAFLTILTTGGVLLSELDPAIEPPVGWR